MPELSVVIPTRQRDELLRRALRCLARQALAPGSFEVIVVRDAGDRAGGEIERDRWPFDVRWLRAQREGASAARNVGWQAASAPVVLFIGDDILAGRELVSAHLDFHRRERASELGLLGRVRWARGLRVTAFMRWLERGIQFDYEPLDRGAEPGWWHLYTANSSVKREMLERVGGFDEERFPFLYEDIDLGARMAAHGFSLRYEPHAEAGHFHPQGIADWRERVGVIARAERRFIERHHGAVPYYHDLFIAALARPPASSRGARLASFVPRSVPWLGSRVWASADLRWRQQLGARFMAAWADADEMPERS